VCETWGAEILALFERQHDALNAAHPDSKEEIRLVSAALITIGSVAQISPSVNGKGEVWRDLTTTQKAERVVLYKHLDGKALFTGKLPSIKK
jgi:hypothetical protein